LFPIQTGIFPAKAPPCPKCGNSNYDPFAEWRTQVNEQLNHLNGQAEDGFSPSFLLLDELINSIRITK
jgi:hypothetical protein